MGGGSQEPEQKPCPPHMKSEVRRRLPGSKKYISTLLLSQRAYLFPTLEAQPQNRTKKYQSIPVRTAPKEKLEYYLPLELTQSYTKKNTLKFFRLLGTKTKSTTHPTKKKKK